MFQGVTFTQPPNRVQNCIPLDCGKPRITPEIFGTLAADEELPPGFTPEIGEIGGDAFAALLEGLKIAGGSRY